MNIKLVFFPMVYFIAEAIFFVYTPLFGNLIYSNEINQGTIDSIITSTYLLFTNIIFYLFGIIYFYSYYQFDNREYKKIKLNIFPLKVILLITASIYVYQFDILNNILDIRKVTFNREGQGYLYVLYWNVLFLYAFLILFNNSKYKFIELLFIFPLLYITGSKKSFILITLVYICNQIIDNKRIFKEAIILFFCFILSFFIYSGVDLSQLIDYIIGYFDHQIRGGEFIQILKNIDFDKTLLLDQYWAYLPRAIFPNKPHVYGDLYLIEAIVPNALETGYAPGIPYWGYIYAVGGIILSALVEVFSGLLMAFLVYKTDRKENIVYKILLMQFLFGIFIYPSRAHLFLILIPIFILLFKKKDIKY